MRVHIRWMIRRDLAEVLEIEKLSFDIPWSEEQFCKVLRQQNCVGMVAEHGERVAGFMIYDLHRTKLHLVELAVHPDYRRQGVGNQMIVKLTGKLTSHQRSKITLHVRERSVGAQLFYQTQGFRAMEVIRDYYFNEGQDAYLMAYTHESGVLV